MEYERRPDETGEVHRQAEDQDHRPDADAASLDAGDPASAAVCADAALRDLGNLALRRAGARPGTGTTSPAASTPARISTLRSTGSPARIYRDGATDTSTCSASWPRRSSSTARRKPPRTSASCSRPSTSRPGRRSTARSPKGAWVLMRTDWSKRDDPAKFLNMKEDGPHVPGPNADAVRFLVEERDVNGWGVEAVGTDAGQAFSFEPAFPAHPDARRRTSSASRAFAISTSCRRPARSSSRLR